ncbi:DUF4307 domain-containing protein [Corynebacterium sp. LK2510]|uniref:DUF4307 domain-containing protein n=1 Tax=Corynebacterium sp. LK2510 TaxID=3110472 RepID=UPI0034CD12C4
MSTPTSVPQTQSHRYGDPARRSTPSGVGGKVLAIAAVLVIVLIAVAFGRNVMERRAIPVSADFITQEHVDDSTTRLWIDVQRKDPSVASYCIVTAVDYEFAEVGRREVVIPAGGEKLTRIGVDVPVRSPGVSGRVYGCSDDIPFYLDTSQASYEAR